MSQIDLGVGDNASNIIAGSENTQTHNDLAPSQSQNVTPKQSQNVQIRMPMSMPMPNRQNDPLSITERDFAQIERLTRAVEDLTRASYELRLELQRTRSELRDEFQEEIASLRQQLANSATKVSFSSDQMRQILYMIVIAAVVVFFLIYWSANGRAIPQ